MSIEVKPLFSGSSGNCTLITAGGRSLLIDAGVSAKKICEALGACGTAPDMIEALFVTHDHIDHVRGISVLSKRYHVPVFMNLSTARACVDAGYFSPDDIADSFYLYEKDVVYVRNGLEVRSFPIPHDAADPVGYRIEYEGEHIAAATDTGHVTDGMLAHFEGCRTAVIEANHDPDMLENGPYPRMLKDRIASPVGHLSNIDCALFAQKLAESGTERIILAHISAENNTPELAYETVRGLTGEGVYIETAARDFARG